MMIRFLLAGALAFFGWAECLSEESDSFSVVNGAIRSQQDAAILAALERREDWDTTGWTITDLAQQFEKRLNCRVTVDDTALSDYRLSADTILPTLKLHDARRRSVLRQALARWDLTWRVVDAELQITTWEVAEVEPTLFVFPVSDLTAGNGVAAGHSDSLIGLITSTISPGSWSMGNNQDAFLFAGSLVIPQAYDIGERIGRLLTALRQLRESETDPDQIKRMSYPVDPLGRASAILSQHISITKQTVQLRVAVERLARAGGFNAQIDVRAIEDECIDERQLVEIGAQNESVSRVATRLVRQLGLAWTFEDDMLLVITEEELEARPAIRLYPVHDLATADRASGKQLLYNPFEWPARRDAGDVDSLVAAITGTIDMNGWAGAGGPFSIEVFSASRVLVVSQTLCVHEEIENLLTLLRRAKRQENTASHTAERPIVELHRIYITADVRAESVARLVREQFPDSPLIEVIGQSLLVRSGEATLLEMFQTLDRLGFVDRRRMENPFGGDGFGGGRLSDPDSTK